MWRHQIHSAPQQYRAGAWPQKPSSQSLHQYMRYEQRSWTSRTILMMALPAPTSESRLEEHSENDTKRQIPSLHA